MSGVRGYRVRIGGRDAIVATAIPLGDLPEGGTPVEVRTVSGAGVESTAVRTLLRLDRTAPVVTASGVPGGEGWSREPVVVGLRGARPGGAVGRRRPALDDRRRRRTRPLATRPPSRSTPTAATR